MSDLDDKLKAVKVPVTVAYSTDGSSQVEKWVHLADAEVAHIKQAFADAGYVQAHSLPKGIYTATGHSLMQISAEEAMTGAEWYDRFLDEFHELPVEDYKNGHAWLKIARIAAGIDNQTKEQN